MFSKIKSMWQSMKDVISHLPGVALTVVGISLGILTLGIPILVTAVLSGVAVVLSLVFVLMAMPKQAKEFCIKNTPKYGWILDAIITGTLTVIGFKISVTMGLVGMLVGFNISALLSWMRFLEHMKKPVATGNVIDV
jgi:hypothetical protein